MMAVLTPFVLVLIILIGGGVWAFTTARRKIKRAKKEGALEVIAAQLEKEELEHWQTVLETELEEM